VEVKTPIDYSIPRKKDCARYKMHKYWAGKPWYVVSEYIRHYTKEGDIVLDPFCGSGVVGCESLINNRRVVLNDLNPMAVFISKNTCCSPVDLGAFLEEFEAIKDRIGETIMTMYEMEQLCPICGQRLYAKHIVRGPSQKGDWIVEARCRNNHGSKGKIRRHLTQKEKQNIMNIENKDIPYWFPRDEFCDGKEIMRLKKAGINYVYQLFTRRNLLALSMIAHEINKIHDKTLRELMLLAFSNTLLHASKLKSEDLRPMSANSYYCMDNWIEENVWVRFENRVKWRWGVLEGKRETNSLIKDKFNVVDDFEELEKCGSFMLLNRPAQNLDIIPDESIDYSFTDPPYGGSIQYYELTFLWRAWLKMQYGNITSEVTINDFQGKDQQTFEDMLTKAFREIYRVLKPGRWLSVTFNNRDQRIWAALLRSCKTAGFDKVNIVPQKPVTSSFVQSWTAKSLKSDLILNFKKPYVRSFSINASDILINSFDPSANLNVSADEGMDSICAEDIIVTSAKEHLSKNKKATLAELFEQAIIKWIDLLYGNLAFHDKDKALSKDKGGKLHEFKHDEKLDFDMEFVDSCLSREAFINRKMSEGQICYYLEENDIK
jgi:SAM-dependent methyltransferase